jgi:hypothetical protein
MKTRTLYCKAGEHEWQRPAQKGRAPLNCPEHSEVKTNNKMSGLDKARAAKASKKVEAEKEWADRVAAVINDHRMTDGLSSYSYTDARHTTITKLQYIQNQLSNNRENREPTDISMLEDMREKIMRDPFNRSGHLF